MLKPRSCGLATALRSLVTCLVPVWT